MNEWHPPKQRMTIFGGTFNPVHWAHLLMAETALCQFSLDWVIWVPTYRPTYKADSELVDFHHRLTMVQQAVISHPRFAVSAIEQHQPSASYAIDTFLALQKLYPSSEWFWLIGLDAFQSLPRWYQYQELVPQCQWLVIPRWVGAVAASQSPQSSLAMAQQIAEQVAAKLAAQSVPLNWHLLDMPLVDISSSLIRQYCCKQRSIRYLVPDVIRDYINQHGLYSNTDQP